MLERILVLLTCLAAFGMAQNDTAFCNLTHGSALANLNLTSQNVTVTQNHSLGTNSQIFFQPGTFIIFNQPSLIFFDSNPDANCPTTTTTTTTTTPASTGTTTTVTTSAVSGATTTTAGGSSSSTTTATGGTTTPSTTGGSSAASTTTTTQITRVTTTTAGRGGTTTSVRGGTTTTTTITTTTPAGLGNTPAPAASTGIIGGAAGGGGAVLLVLILILLVVFRRRNRNATSPAVDGPTDGAEIKHVQLNMKEIISQSFSGLTYRAEFKDGVSKISVAARTPPQGADKTVRNQILKELALVRRVGLHSNLVDFVGQCTREQPFMIITEFCPNGNLRDYLRRNRAIDNQPSTLTTEDQLKFCGQIAAGMAYLESKGVVHGDLSARSVLVSSERICKLNEFGIQRDVYLSRNELKMPIRWMGPECIRTSSVSAKSDVWAFGVTAWEIFTFAATPYADIADVDLLRYLERGSRLARPATCAVSVFETMIEPCWNSNPDSRPYFASLSQIAAKQVDRPSSYEQVAPSVSLSVNPLYEEPGTRSLAELQKRQESINSEMKYSVLHKTSARKVPSSSNDDDDDNAEADYENTPRALDLSNYENGTRPNNYEIQDDYSHLNTGTQSYKTSSDDYSHINADMGSNNYSQIPNQNAYGVASNNYSQINTIPQDDYSHINPAQQQGYAAESDYNHINANQQQGYGAESDYSHINANQQGYGAESDYSHINADQQGYSSSANDYNHINTLQGFGSDDYSQLNRPITTNTTNNRASYEASYPSAYLGGWAEEESI